MLFGEIVEPSTRALIDEDFDEYPEVTESSPEWQGAREVPNEINTLVFIETDKVKKLFHSCVLQERKAVARIKNGGVEISDIGNRKYVVTFSEKRDLTYGQITESLKDWIKTAKNVYTITSDSISNYQNINLPEKPFSLIRVLTNDTTNSFGYERLESPNLISGFGASVLTYCIHLGIKCTLFITYVDTSPLDSVNMGPLIGLLERIEIPITHNELKITTSASNLYM
ncbi:hypothetical protein NQ317_004996 [Molorchus minor]|uniref:Proteasome assembly chaperone 1 n=1 Tax=Molorchus minor TaxID=1323400 RepID=A0ABQ9K3T8_9CUCU|nr:hypothetical protein NQ317_004996 [Molorchus minor]